MTTTPPSRLHRRSVLLGGGAALVLAACSSADPSEPTATTRPGTTARPTPDGTDTPPVTATILPHAPDLTTDLVAADFADLPTCVLLPAQTPGPFPLDHHLVRREIHEGHPGHPLRLGLRVVDVDCAPVAGAAVEVWHTDAGGDYSGFTDNNGRKDEGAGTTFCRGTQVADEAGIVEVQTIYPGWYPGRTPHLHIRVHVDGATALTTQLYFDEAHTAEVYATDPYAELGSPDTSNDRDVIAGDPAAEGTLLVVAAADTPAGPGTLGLANLGIRT